MSRKLVTMIVTALLAFGIAVAVPSSADARHDTGWDCGSC